MSHRWLIVALSCLFVSVVMSVGGFVILDLRDFVQNLVAEMVGLLAAFGIAIFLIEGRFLSEQARRRKIVARLAGDLIREKAEALNMIPMELASYLASVLKPQMDFGLRVERASKVGGDDWESDVRPALLAVFHQAKGTRVKDINIFDPIPESEYRNWVKVTEDLISELRRRIENNLDLYEKLLELIDALQLFDKTVRECKWPQAVRTDDSRLQALSDLGIAYVDFLDKLGSVSSKL